MVQGKDESGGWKEGRKASPAAAATTTTYYYSRWSLLFVFDGNLSVCIKVAQSMYVTPHRHRHHNHHHPTTTITAVPSTSIERTTKPPDYIKNEQKNPK